MFYAWDIKLLNSQTELTETRQFLWMERGTITRFELTFPTGCAGLVYVHVDHALHQLYPKNPLDRLRGNGSTIIASDEYEIKEPPFALEVHGWNTDDTYDHTVTIRIQLVPAKEIIHRVIGGLTSIMKITKP